MTKLHLNEKKKTICRTKERWGERKYATTRTSFAFLCCATRKGLRNCRYVIQIAADALK